MPNDVDEMCQVYEELKLNSDLISHIHKNMSEHADEFGYWGGLGSGLRTDKGENYFDLRMYFAAEICYLFALRRFSSHKELTGNYGILLQEWGRLEEALKLHKQSLQINPKYFNALHNAGFCCEMLKKFDEAIVFFSKALEVKPDSAITKELMEITRKEKAAGKIRGNRPGTVSRTLVIPQYQKKYWSKSGLWPMARKFTAKKQRPEPRIFISYKWTDREADAWVAKLVKDIAKRGYDVVFDRNDELKRKALNVPELIKREVDCTHFMAILTEAYCSAIDVNGLKGNLTPKKDSVVYDEWTTAMLLAAEDKMELIGIRRSGNNVPLPFTVKTALDFRTSEKYQDKLNGTFPYRFNKRNKMVFGQKASMAERVHFDCRSQVVFNVNDNHYLSVSITKLRNKVVQKVSTPTTKESEQINIKKTQTDLERWIEEYLRRINERKYIEAFDYYASRLAKRLINQSMQHELCIKLLLKLFPDGEDANPKVENERIMARIHGVLGLSLGFAGYLERAKFQLKKAIAIEKEIAGMHRLIRGLPKSAFTDSRNIVACVLLPQGDFSSARDMIQQRGQPLPGLPRRVKLEPVDALQMALVLAHLGKFDEAKQTLNSVGFPKTHTSYLIVSGEIALLEKDAKAASHVAFVSSFIDPNIEIDTTTAIELRILRGRAAAVEGAEGKKLTGAKADLEEALKMATNGCYFEAQLLSKLGLAELTKMCGDNSEFGRLTTEIRDSASERGFNVIYNQCGGHKNLHY